MKSSVAWSQVVGGAQTRTGLLAAGALVAAMVAHVPAQDINLSALGTTHPGFVINGAAFADYAGRSLSTVGDMNGDGLADVVVGAFGADGGGPGSGEAYVVFGRTGSAQVELSSLGVGGFRIIGAASAEFAGAFVSGAGDVNGDGLADVVIGAPFADPGGRNDAGVAYVVFGKTTTSTVQLTALGTGGFVIEGAGVSDNLGYSVSGAGDVNGDGLADVIVGAQQVSFPNGAAYVVFGKTSTGTVAADSLGAGGFVMRGPLGASTRVGHSVSGAGDVNGDGLADVVVGAHTGDSGAAAVVFGRTITSLVELSALGANGFRIAGIATGDRAGFSVAGLGDVNGDNLGDVVVGANDADALGRYTAGQAYVVFGRTATSQIQLSALGTGGFVIHGAAAADNCGYSVAGAGDVNGDGLADIMVGSDHADPAGSSGAGQSHLVFGKSTSTAVDLASLGTRGFALNGWDSGARAGSGVSGMGDVNGDGLADLLVGGLYADTTGQAYVVFSPYGYAPLAPATSSTYRTHVESGSVNSQGIGAGGLGDDRTLPHDARARVGFVAGSGPGLAGSSLVTATITRNDTGIVGFLPSMLANVQWQISTDRTGWSGGLNFMNIAVHYTDAEVAGLAEGNLRLYSAPTAAGPFALAGISSVNTARNEVTGTTASLPKVFVISTNPPDTTPPSPVITPLMANPTANQAPTWQLSWSESVIGTLDAGDISPTGTLGASVGHEQVGSGPPHTIRLYTTTENADGTLGFDVSAGAVTDFVGNPSVAGSAPVYEIDEVGAGLLAGDVNKDGSVNAADITTLGNHIVNGDPLP